MTELDVELRSALRREEPPDGFVERVVRRVGEEAPHQSPTSHRSLFRWLAAAAVVVAVTGAGMQYRTAQTERARAERAEGEAAGRQVELALRIAGSKLQLVQTKIARLHEQPDRNSNP